MTRVTLVFSLLVAFTTSAAAALCLQMEHTSGAMTGSAVAMGPTVPTSNTEAAVLAAVPKGSPSTQACCHQQVSTPAAVAPPQRAVPAEPADVLPLAVVQLSAENGHAPPGLFDPALEKLDHLTPSLTELSISRT